MPMSSIVSGFWGCYFGTTVLMLVGSAFAFGHSLRRVSLNAALSAAGSAFFVIAFLGGFPIQDPDLLARFLAHVASAISALLAYLLLSILGVLRHRGPRLRARMALLLLSAAVIVAGWMLKPVQALVLSQVLTGVLGLAGLVLCLRSALRGDRLAWLAVSGVFFMLVALCGLGWIALDRDHVPWQVHAISALAATAYLATMASVLWKRYSYLIELDQVMAYGPSYDPVTRMRSHSETTNMVGAAFKLRREVPMPLGVVVVTIANLPVLEKLYGLATLNHALFVIAGRLRRIVPAHIEMGRLDDDGFLLLMRNCSDSGPLIELARAVQVRLSEIVVLDTSQGAGPAGSRQTRWAAEVGVGVQKVFRVDARAASAVTLARDMSRAAWSYASRVAWYDDRSGQIVGMPVATD